MPSVAGDSKQENSAKCWISSTFAVHIPKKYKPYECATCNTTVYKSV